MRQGLSSFFRTETADIGDVRGRLWNDQIGAPAYAGEAAPYQAALFEQYKLYVEMADRISARRALANGFFLSLNTGVFAIVGALWTRLDGNLWLHVVALPVLLLQAGAWFWMIRSYRQLNAAKYAVIGALEERLPASPYWRAEWLALGEGRDRTRYWPMTHVEHWVPIAFAILYLVGFVAAVIT